MLLSYCRQNKCPRQSILDLNSCLLPALEAERPESSASRATFPETSSAGLEIVVEPLCPHKISPLMSPDPLFRQTLQDLVLPELHLQSLSDTHISRNWGQELQHMNLTKGNLSSHNSFPKSENTNANCLIGPAYAVIMRGNIAVYLVKMYQQSIQIKYLF